MTSKIEAAIAAVQASGVLEYLAAYRPTLVSSILAELDTQDSDIDVLCCYGARREDFVADFSNAFAGRTGYSLRSAGEAMVGTFQARGFLIEVYASAQAVQDQPGYRHFLIMQRIHSQNNPRLMQVLRGLKVAGLKTEPAICRFFGLAGDPYLAVLAIEQWSERELGQRVVDALARWDNATDPG